MQERIRPATHSYNETALARDKTDHSMGCNYRGGGESTVIFQVIGVNR